MYLLHEKAQPLSFHYVQRQKNLVGGCEYAIHKAAGMNIEEDI